jgi:hypothetical protein
MNKIYRCLSIVVAIVKLCNNKTRQWPRSGQHDWIGQFTGGCSPDLPFPNLADPASETAGDQYRGSSICMGFTENCRNELCKLFVVVRNSPEKGGLRDSQVSQLVVRVISSLYRDFHI